MIFYAEDLVLLITPVYSQFSAKTKVFFPFSLWPLPLLPFILEKAESPIKKLKKLKIKNYSIENF